MYFTYEPYCSKPIFNFFVGKWCHPQGNAVQSVPWQNWPCFQCHQACLWSYCQQTSQVSWHFHFRFFSFIVSTSYLIRDTTSQETVQGKKNLFFWVRKKAKFDLNQGKLIFLQDAWRNGCWKESNVTMWFIATYGREKDFRLSLRWTQQSISRVLLMTD